MTTLPVQHPGRCILTVGTGSFGSATMGPPSTQNRRFVLLNRDGTLIIHKPYLADPSGVELCPGVIPGLRHLQEAGFGLVIVTNQSGIGRKLFTYDQLNAIQGRLLELLMREGVMIDGLYFCPHTPQDQCACRKPKPRLIERAAQELGFKPAQAFVIGDSSCEIELARNVGAAAILIQASHTRRGELTASPDFIASTMSEAAQWILTQASLRQAA